MFESYTFVSDN